MSEDLTSDGSAVVGTPGQPNASTLDPRLVDASTRAVLAAAVGMNAPTVVAVVSEHSDLARDTALLLGRRWLLATASGESFHGADTAAGGDAGSPQVDSERALIGAALDNDIVVSGPSGERWTRDELDELVITRVERLPIVRHVLVVEACDDMDLRAAERLLKTLEDPASPTTFLLCVRDLTGLPATIRGRVELVLPVAPAPEDERIEAMVVAGTPREAARVAVTLAGRAVALAPLLAADERVAALAERLLAVDAWRDTERPVTHAFELAGLCTQLAGCWEAGKFVETSSTSTTPRVRARARLVIRLGIDRYRAVTGQMLLDHAASRGGVLGDETPGVEVSLRRIHDRVSSAYRAEEQLRTYASPPLVLAGLFVPQG